MVWSLVAAILVVAVAAAAPDLPAGVVRASEDAPVSALLATADVTAMLLHSAEPESRPFEAHFAAAARTATESAVGELQWAALDGDDASLLAQLAHAIGATQPPAVPGVYLFQRGARHIVRCASRGDVHRDILWPAMRLRGDDAVDADSEDGFASAVDAAETDGVAFGVFPGFEVAEVALGRVVVSRRVDAVFVAPSDAFLADAPESFWAAFNPRRTALTAYVGRGKGRTVRSLDLRGIAGAEASVQQGVIDRFVRQALASRPTEHHAHTTARPELKELVTVSCDRPSVENSTVVVDLIATDAVTGDVVLQGEAEVLGVGPGNTRADIPPFVAGDGLLGLCVGSKRQIVLPPLEARRRTPVVFVVTVHSVRPPSEADLPDDL